jgi:hypothetical protein
LSNLPDGLYGITISDDYNRDDYIGRGLGDPGCAGDPIQVFPKTSHFFYVDTVPPSIGGPTVTTSDKTAQITVAASDEGTGIGNFEWTMGDGVVLTTTSETVRYTYLRYGTYAGVVRANDRAGNGSSTTFRVDLNAPAASPPSSNSLPAIDGDDPAPALSASAAKAYAISALRKRFGRSYKKGQHRKVACRSRISRLRRKCRVSWRYKTWRYRGTVTVWHTNYDWRDSSYSSLRVLRTGNPCGSKSCPRVYSGQNETVVP